MAIQSVNALFVALLAVALSATTGRALFAILIAGGFHALLVYADRVKSSVLHAHVIYADSHIVPMLLLDPSLVFGFIVKSPWHAVIGLTVTVATLVFAWKGHKLRAPAVARLLVTVGSLAIFATFLFSARGIAPTDPQWNVFQQTDETPLYGVMANIVYGMRASAPVAPPGDPNSQQRLISSLPIRNAEAKLTRANTITPDIVIVQSESLFDPSTLCGTHDDSQLPAITSGRHGDLMVPVFGGRTLQTEFETLTGLPVAMFPNANFSYLDLIPGSLNALPRELSRLGYRTIAIHPNDRNFWRRSYAFPAMGFDSFIDIRSFSGVDVGAGGHVTDKALMTAALSEIDADKGPSFIFVITMENHGPWGGHGTSELDDYTGRAQEADAAWRNLTEQLAKRGRPAIAVLYGDHLPGLPETYSSRCFKDGQPPERHMPPVAVWSNIPGDDRPPPTASFLIPGWILDTAHLPRSQLFAINGAIGLIAEQDGMAAVDRLKTDYAASAWNWLRNSDPVLHSRAPLKPNAIAKMLTHSLVKGHRGSWTPQDLLIDATPTPDAAVVLQLDGKTRSITFRPYPGSSSCDETDPIEVRVDGRVVGRIRGAPGANLATINTTDASKLSLMSTPESGVAKCQSTVIRVVQVDR
ncbi:LTA synthase family protein [Luteibacter yeojuensis]|uniref:LTA synthase family protein n=1 Tax=Luteibacter yeojuensis TaxID=345309 RepID=A0A7X5TPS6_9GAMM|nr:LTA synthase family protein [Luteibacter yeojuensis]NID15766.1 LTA synthase family protein [Luteibacter yeojuensis]